MPSCHATLSCNSAEGTGLVSTEQPLAVRSMHQLIALGLFFGGIRKRKTQRESI